MAQKAVLSAVVIVHGLLVFSVMVGQAVSECNVIADSSGTVYLQYNASGLISPLITPPLISRIDNNHQLKNCCQSEDRSEFICSSIDDALDIIREINENATSSFLLALIGEKTLVYEMKKPHTVSNFTSLVVQSFNSSISISCSDNVTLSIDHVCSLTILSMSFLRCGTTVDGGIEIENVPFVNISDSVVSGSTSSGIKLNIKLSPSSFCTSTMNNNVPFIILSNMTLSSNGWNDQSLNSKLIYGGGIEINLMTAVEVNIIESKFIENIASIGGGLAYSTADQSSYLRVLDCEFIGNNATIHAGAVHLSATRTIFENSTFHNNTARYTAGAVYQFVAFLSVLNEGNVIKYKNCSFEGNYAEGSGCMLFSSSITASPEVSQVSTAVISECIFRNNSAKRRQFFGQTSCMIYSADVKLFLEDSDFLHNSVTALCIQSASIELSGNIEFKFNRGYFGGAINTHRSILKILSHANVTFYSNEAVFGGAIYENGALAELNKCLFEFPNEATFNITFELNTAISRGNSIYYSMPNDQCIRNIQHDGVSIATDQVTSEANTIIFHEPVYTDTQGLYTINLTLGQQIVFNVSVLDYFNTSSFSQVNILLQSWDEADQTSIPYMLVGFQHISLENGLNRPNLSIAGPNLSIAGYDTNDTLDQYKLLVRGIHSFGDIRVNLKPCPLGFVYDTQKHQCVCFDSEFVSCDVTLAKSCIMKGYWIGDINNNNESKPSVAPCASSLFCGNNNGFCDLCPIADKTDFCLLPQSTADQCLDNRHGFLCRECRKNYALTFGAVKCIKDDSCDEGKEAIPAVLNVIFLIFTIVMLIVVLKLDYKLSSGYLFCFIYYFSIIRHLVEPIVVGNGMLLFISILTSVTQLNPQFLGYIPICFGRHFTVLQQQAFLYINPVVISCFVLLVIGISRYFSKYIKFGDNTIVKAICLLLLLSFTAFTETSFNILNPVQFNSIPGEYFVNIEPSTKYFNLSKHLPFFIIGLLAFVFLVIPFTFLLLFAPLLTKCFNLNKIKPFLDEFQGCYKDKFRWMAGYYFAARFIYILLLTAPRYIPVFTQYVIQLLSFGILVIHMLIQPYQNRWMNFADSVLLADIVLVTLLFGKTADAIFEDTKFHLHDLRLALTCILILIPVFYLIVVIIVTVRNNWIRVIAEKVRNFLQIKSNMDDEDTLIKKEVTHTSVERERSLSISIGLREPLLEIMDNAGQRSASVSPARRNKHSSIGYSIVGSPRDHQMYEEEDERSVLDFTDDRNNTKFKHGYKSGSSSVSSQSWMENTVSSQQSNDNL